MFQTEHILASNYKTILQTHINPLIQGQLQNAKTLIYKHQTEIISKSQQISNLKHQIQNLKTKIQTLQQLANNPSITNDNTLSPLNSNYTESELLKTPKSSNTNPHYPKSESSESYYINPRSLYSSFNINTSLDESISYIPEWLNKPLPYKKFKTLVKLFVQTLAYILKMMMKFKNYKNQNILDSLKKNVVQFINDFNNKHQLKKSQGWNEQQQTQAISVLKVFGDQIRQAFNLTFGKTTQSKSLSKNFNYFSKTIQK